MFYCGLQQHRIHWKVVEDIISRINGDKVKGKKLSSSRLFAESEQNDTLLCPYNKNQQNALFSSNLFQL